MELEKHSLVELKQIAEEKGIRLWQPGTPEA